MGFYYCHSHHQIQVPRVFLTCWLIRPTLARNSFRFMIIQSNHRSQMAYNKINRVTPIIMFHSHGGICRKGVDRTGKRAEHHAFGRGSDHYRDWTKQARRTAAHLRLLLLLLWWGRHWILLQRHAPIRILSRTTAQYSLIVHSQLL